MLGKFLSESGNLLKMANSLRMFSKERSLIKFLRFASSEKSGKAGNFPTMDISFKMLSVGHTQCV